VFAAFEKRFPLFRSLQAKHPVDVGGKEDPVKVFQI
jgi:hypothetical protein